MVVGRDFLTQTIFNILLLADPKNDSEDNWDDNHKLNFIDD